MRLISIDVGIKNLAFCILENGKETQICKWDVVNLTQKIDAKCVEIEKTGTPCNKPAKFTKNSKCYCLKHSKKLEYLIPTAELKKTYIQKQTVQSLYEIADKYKIDYKLPIKKTELVSIINEYIFNKCFEPIETVNSNKIDLLNIGKNIQYKLDEIIGKDIETIDKVIIENQISPIANRMKTIQGMIAQYFIMRNNCIDIDFVNASNKLKTGMEKSEKPEKTTYSERKKLGIEKTKQFLQKNHLIQWETYFNSHTKKDDLADSLLQGLWYFEYKM